MEATNIEISVKGITTTLTFDKRTAELYPHQMSAIMQLYPDRFTEYAALFRPPALAYCGYYIHCKDSQKPLKIPFDDFLIWSTQTLKTASGRHLMNQINELYSKHAEA